MTDFNPYQPPNSADGPHQNCWRQGNRVYLAAGAPLPCRCRHCGQDCTAAEAQAGNLSWLHPLWYLLLPLATLACYALMHIVFESVPIWAEILPISMALVAVLLLHKQVKLTVAVCRRCRWLRRLEMAGLFAAWLLFGMLFAWSVNNRHWLAWLGLSGWIAVFLIVAARGAQRLRILKIDGNYCIILLGFGQGFLNRLPENA